VPTLKDKVSFPLSSLTTYRSKPPANQKLANKAARMTFNRRVTEPDLRIFQGKGK
jgi:hypothetical protein